MLTSFRPGWSAVPYVPYVPYRYVPRRPLWVELGLDGGQACWLLCVQSLLDRSSWKFGHWARRHDASSEPRADPNASPPPRRCRGHTATSKAGHVTAAVRSRSGTSGANRWVEGYAGGTLKSSNDGQETG